MDDTLDISIGKQLIRTEPARHDHTREHGVRVVPAKQLIQTARNQRASTARRTVTRMTRNTSAGEAWRARWRSEEPMSGSGHIDRSANLPEASVRTRTRHSRRLVGVLVGFLPALRLAARKSGELRCRTRRWDQRGFVIQARIARFALVILATCLTVGGLSLAQPAGPFTSGTRTDDPVAGKQHAPEVASSTTSVETSAVNWAISKIGSTSYGSLCLTLVTDAYQSGASFNIETLTKFGSFDNNTYPQEVWSDGFTAGTTGDSATTPPYGALVFFNASGAGANDPADYSHVTIMGSAGEMISTNDVVNENAVHYETMADLAGKHPFNSYVGWWLPDGSSTPPSPVQMILDGSGEVWARNSIGGTSGWTLESSAGEKAISAGSNGVQMILDGSGEVWARNSIGGTSGWTLESSAGEKAISAGSNFGEEPDVTPPSVAMSAPSSLVRLSTSVPVAWTGSDNAGIAHFDVRRSSTPWTSAPSPWSMWLSPTSATSATYAGAYGQTDCFSVRAQDNVGNLSGWSLSRCTSVPLRSDQLAHSSGWTKATNSASFAGFDYSTKTHGASMTRTSIVARRLSLVVSECASCGTVQVRWNGTVIANVNTYHASTIHRQVIQVANWRSAPSGTLVISVTSTTGKTVAVEGLDIYNS